MREIIFRGKRNDNGKWVEGTYYHQTEFYGNDFDEYYIIASKDELEDNMMIFYKVIPETIGQFTGLTDKNGTKIFEGDVVEFKDDLFHYSNVGVGCFKNGCYGIEYIDKYIPSYKKFHRIGQTDYYKDMGSKTTIDYIYKIIGNIHDNPELLRGDAE